MNFIFNLDLLNLWKLTFILSLLVLQLLYYFMVEIHFAKLGFLQTLICKMNENNFRINLLVQSIFFVLISEEIYKCFQVNQILELLLDFLAYLDHKLCKFFFPKKFQGPQRSVQILSFFLSFYLDFDSCQMKRIPALLFSLQSACPPGARLLIYH